MGLFYIIESTAFKNGKGAIIISVISGTFFFYKSNLQVK
jgi:hypothetical protein